MDTALGPPEGEGYLAVVHDLLRLVGIDVGGGARFGEDVQGPGLPVRCQRGVNGVGGFVTLDGKARTLWTLAKIIGVENSATARVQFRISLQLVHR